MALNILLSYALHADTKLDRVRAGLMCGRLLIDSGAFTAHTKGRPISIDAYAEYLERWRGCWDHAITLDVIGDHAATARNTRILHDRGLPVMPVFTRGGRVEDFRAMVRDVGFVCVGGLVGMPKPDQVRRVGPLQRIAEDLGGGIHALGIGSLETLRKTRPYSADASSVSGSYRFGTVTYFDGQRVKAVGLTDTAKLRADHAVIRDHGIDLARLATERRMPGNRDGGRQALMRAMTLAYVAADEQLKRPGVPPAAPGLAPGTHLYTSMGANIPDVMATAQLDQQLHSPDADVPPIWRRYRRSHTCHRRALSHAPS